MITSVALDNLTLSTEAEIAPELLLAWGEAISAHLEAKRDDIAKAWADMMIFGVGDLRF